MEDNFKKKIPHQVMHFLLQDSQLCVDLLYLDRILLLPQLEVVPCSPPYVVGLMNLAGTSIPVIDLRLRLDLSRDQNYSLNTPILLCVHENHQAGILVDHILELADVNSDSIQYPEEFNTPNSPFSATIAYQSHFSLLINVEVILASIFSINLTKLNFNSVSESTLGEN